MQKRPAPNRRGVLLLDASQTVTVISVLLTAKGAA
jgi:hypothetical protein